MKSKLTYLLQEDRLHEIQSQQEKEMNMIKRLYNYYKNTYLGANDDKFKSWIYKLLADIKKEAELKKD